VKGEKPPFTDAMPTFGVYTGFWRAVLVSLVIKISKGNVAKNSDHP